MINARSWSHDDTRVTHSTATSGVRISLLVGLILQLSLLLDKPKDASGVLVYVFYGCYFIFAI